MLQNSGRELFILSEYILNCKRYHSEYADITWLGCDLRKWLNDEFYDAAFNAAQKGFIKTTHCTDNGEGSPDTEDKVFLLNVSEVKELTGKLGEDSLSTKRRARCINYVSTSWMPYYRKLSIIWHPNISFQYINSGFVWLKPKYLNILLMIGFIIGNKQFLFFEINAIRQPENRCLIRKVQYNQEPY